MLKKLIPKTRKQMLATSVAVVAVLGLPAGIYAMSAQNTVQVESTPQATIVEPTIEKNDPVPEPNNVEPAKTEPVQQPVVTEPVEATPDDEDAVVESSPTCDKFRQLIVDRYVNRQDPNGNSYYGPNTEAMWRDVKAGPYYGIYADCVDTGKIQAI